MRDAGGTAGVGRSVGRSAVARRGADAFLRVEPEENPRLTSVDRAGAANPGSVRGFGGPTAVRAANPLKTRATICSAPRQQGHGGGFHRVAHVLLRTSRRWSGASAGPPSARGAARRPRARRGRSATGNGVSGTKLSSCASPTIASRRDQCGASRTPREKPALIAEVRELLRPLVDRSRRTPARGEDDVERAERRGLCETASAGFASAASASAESPRRMTRARLVVVGARRGGTQDGDPRATSTIRAARAAAGAAGSPRTDEPGLGDALEPRSPTDRNPNARSRHSALWLDPAEQHVERPRVRSSENRRNSPWTDERVAAPGGATKPRNAPVPPAEPRAGVRRAEASTSTSIRDGPATRALRTKFPSSSESVGEEQLAVTNGDVARPGARAPGRTAMRGASSNTMPACTSRRSSIASVGPPVEQVFVPAADDDAAGR